MTALDKYARLECPGLWRDAPGAQRRDVVVSLGEASLVLSDVKTDVALSHWSLPAVTRCNPGAVPALFAPAPDDDGETLELDDPAMIEAIETVRHAISSTRPARGRLRVAVAVGMLAGGVALSTLWLPEALVTHAVRVVPMAKRAEIGRSILTEIARLSGAPCRAGGGERGVAALAERMFGTGAGAIIVVPGGVPGAVELPGRLMVLSAAVLEEFDTPEVAAGHLLAARLRAETTDPLDPVLRWAGVPATLRLLTTGDLPADALRGYGAQVIAAAGAPVADADLAALFAAADVAIGPYARAIDPDGAHTRALLAADQGAGRLTPAIVSDADWIGLQDICATP